jgi:hypothetical protein
MSTATKVYFNMRFFAGLFIFISFLSAGDTYAQQSSRVKKRTNINFEDELIRGEVQKPELFYIMQKKQFNFSKLIKLRENFIPEMRKSAEDVPRGTK